MDCLVDSCHGCSPQMPGIVAQPTPVDGIDLLGHGNRAVAHTRRLIQKDMGGHGPFLVVGCKNDTDHGTTVVISHIVLDNDNRMGAEDL